MCIIGLRAKFTAYHYYHLTPCHTKLGQGFCDDSGVRTHSYDCPPHIKYVKRFIYVWSRSGMSIKWMRGPHHYITSMIHVKNLRSHLQTLPRLLWWQGVRTQSYDCPPLIKYVKRLLFVWSGSGMSMQGWEVPIISYSMSPVRNPLKILQPSPPFGAMVWYGVVANMTASHGWRIYNTFYRYEVNLAWVCRGWEGPIISYSMSPVRTPLRILLPSPPFWMLI
jgi:hypothetical protein